MINIGIVGNPIVRWALAAAITGADDDLHVVNVGPNVLVTWISGLSVLEAAGITGTGLPCVALGDSTDLAFAARVIQAGAAYYVSTAEAPETLLKAIRHAAGGTLIIPPEVADLVKLGGPAAALTARELQVLKALTRGSSNREIALDLKISVKTVDTHRGHVLKKLRLTGNAALIKFAIRYGYATP